MRGDPLFDGIVAGIIAGAVMMAAEIVISTVQGTSLVSPIRLVSSIALGTAALSRTYPLVTTLVVGICLHLIISASFGVVAFFALARSNRRDAPAGLLLIAGALFGVLLWVFDVMILGAFVFPWFSVVDLIWNGLVAHSIFFGLVLGAGAIVARPGSRR